MMAEGMVYQLLANAIAKSAAIPKVSMSVNYTGIIGLGFRLDLPHRSVDSAIGQVERSTVRHNTNMADILGNRT